MYPTQRLIKLTLLTSTLFSAAGLHAQASAPIATQPTTLTWFAPLERGAAATMQSYAEQTAYKMLAQKTNVTVQFRHPALGSEKESFQLLQASGNYPDVIEWNNWTAYPGGPTKALDNKFIIPLNDLIKQHAPNLQKLLDSNPEIRRQISTDKGDIYCFPMLRLDPKVRTFWGPQIRADWLSKLGLKAPTTIDEWTQVLQAFKTRSPSGKNDVIPYSVKTDPSDPIAPGLPTGLWPFLSAYGLQPNFFQVGGKVLYAPNQPAYKDYLTTMHKWYAAGLIDGDFVSQTGAQLDTKMANNQVGAYAGFIGSGLGRYTRLGQGSTPSFRLVAVPFPAARDGKRHNTWPEAGNLFNGGGAAISSQNKKVIETVRFLDYGYSREGQLAMNFGQEGVSYTMVNGQPRYTDSVIKNPKLPIYEAILQHARPQAGPFVQDPQYLLQFYQLQEQKDAVALWSSSSTELQLPPLSVDASDASRFASTMSNVVPYVAEMTTKFILGKESLDKFDDYLKQLDQMGVNRATALMQKAFDGYAKRGSPLTK
ncbi:extracellular solute-binding protein [Curvibacter sp. CHRR-16]|uniref:extracellular solute-binding protein n=1 Tax=Curvibacter sp. CHRR-16 TaxID=2835872 RepID=UPI001BD95508|nr:extracellular solute-binding protein [Curvibacter sp. CHRR-16]MBT0569940.1 extracellular solute-binding protein [Curvibacter sp. CHRR-16]